MEALSGNADVSQFVKPRKMMKIRFAKSQYNLFLFSLMAQSKSVLAANRSKTAARFCNKSISFSSVYSKGPALCYYYTPRTKIFQCFLFCLCFLESCVGIYFLRGCAGGSDRRERKATPKGVFGRTRRRTPGAWGNPNKRAGISQKDIPAHCLPTLLLFACHTSDSRFHKSTQMIFVITI